MSDNKIMIYKGEYNMLGVLIGKVLCTNCGKLISDPKVVDVTNENKENNINKETIIVCDNCGKLINVNEY